MIRSELQLWCVGLIHLLRVYKRKQQAFQAEMLLLMSMKKYLLCDYFSFTTFLIWIVYTKKYGLFTFCPLFVIKNIHYIIHISDSYIL